MSSSPLGILELDLEGSVVNKSGDFVSMEENALVNFSKKFYFVLQDVHELQKTGNELGAFKKITLKGNNVLYEAAVGEKCIKIYKFLRS